MAVEIVGASGRVVSIEGYNRGCPTSVFVEVSDGTCYEFDREAFVQAVKEEFALCDMTDMMIAHLQAA